MDQQVKFGLLLHVLDHFVEINGRTRVQKMMYLTNLIGWNAITDYHFYQYGPYSQWVRRALDLLVKKRFIEEHEEQIDEEKSIYKYKITEIGKKYLKAIKMDSMELVPKTNSFLDDLQSFNTQDLELMASLYFVRYSDPEIDTDKRLVDVIHLHKPWYKPEKIEKNLKVFSLMEPYTASS